MRGIVSSSAARRNLTLVLGVLLLAFIVWRNKPAGGSADTEAKAPIAGQAPESRALTGSVREGVQEADQRLRDEKARTDVGVSVFPAKAYVYRPQPAGKSQGAPEGQAMIHVPSVGQRASYEANQLGEFPTVLTGLRDTVGVRLSLDGIKAGTPVRVVILDGGKFPTAEGVTQVMSAASWGGVAFEYTTSGNIGTHRVLVQAEGQQSRILDFNALSSLTP